MSTLTLADISAALDRGESAFLSEEAMKYLVALPEDHCFVVTAELDGQYFPTFLIKLSRSTTEFCDAGKPESFEPDFELNSYRDGAGKVAIAVDLSFPNGNHLHLPLDPAHPHVRHWLRLSTSTPAFGLLYLAPSVNIMLTGYQEIVGEQASWVSRTLEWAEQVPEGNAIAEAIERRAATLSPARRHRFLTFADSADPELLMEYGTAWIDGDEDFPDDRDDEPPYDLEWLARAHGIPLTTEETELEPDDLLERMVAVLPADLQGPNLLLRRYGEIARDYPESALLLRGLALLADTVGDRAKYRECVKQLRGLKDRGPHHLFHYLDALRDPREFVREMERLPRPHRLLDHAAEREDGTYHVETFLVHEQVAGRYESIQRDVTAVLLRVDRLVRLGGPTDEFSQLLKGLIVTRMGLLDVDTEYGAMFSFTDFPAALRAQLHEDTLPLLQAEATALLDELALESPPPPVRRAGRKVGRNEPCPCGSGRKYKRCCG